MFFRILILSMVSALLSGADPLCTSCLNEKGNYTGNEKFKTNLDRLLDDLSSNTTRNASQPGFYEASIGDSPDKVYGQALCRGDVDSAVCKNCVRSASQYIFENCESVDAIVWYELCQVRYSSEMFSGMQVYTGKYPDHNDREKEIASNRNKFSEVLMLLMNEVSNETAFNLSRNMFSTGETELSKGKIVYGLSQCTRDIIPGDCRSCLNSAITELGKCCSSQQGGIILSQSCNLRFQLYQFYNITSNSHSTYSFPKGDQWKIWKVLVLIILAFLLVIVIGSYTVFHRQNNRREIDDKGERALLKELTSHTAVTITEDGNLVTSEELPFVALVTIKAATNDFAGSNKLGQGGFGSVYKGVFPNGKELAVKRLSRKSWQGLEEFKNEVILIAKLQHRNLVRLVGCGFEGEEKLLLYEFMPNRSLDFFIFDSDRRSQLDWETYHNIISGIARGLLYLHEESRLKIIHRDLKPSNVLLDLEMVAKISDFGMARIFSDSQNVANTKRVVGTYGYMAPEYAMGGQFSIKSDVFSFGVILLEIISGQKNSGFYQITKHAPTLLAYAWRLWKEGKELEFVDPLLRGSSPTQDVLRCMHVGLLCVQEDPADRPNMSAVVVSLQGRESTPLPDPRQPALSVRRVPINQPMEDHSVNELTISTISPR